MLQWSLVFFVVSIIAALFGFSDIAVGAASIAKVLFVIFVALFLFTLVAALVRGNRRPKSPI